MSGPRTGNPYNAAKDANQNPSLIGVSGTAGTSDVLGTAEVIRIGANPATGAMYVESIGSSGGASSVQYTEGNSHPTPLVGNIILFRNPSDGSLVSPDYSSFGFPVYIVSGNAIEIGPTVTPGTATANLGKQEDGPHASGDTGVFILGVRNDTTTDLTSTDLDYSPIGVDSSGAAHITGRSAHDTGVSFYPVTIGGAASASAPTNVSSDGDAVKAWYKLNGAAVVSMFDGTINAGTFVHPSGTITTIAAGTQNTLGTVGTIQNLISGTINALAAGTITAGSLTTVANVLSITAGTQNTLGTVGVVNNLVSGTLLNSGTTTGVGVVTTVTTVSNVTNGSFVQTAGTLTVGTLTNLVSGTINAIAAGTITGGTLGNLNSGTILNSGTTTGVGVVTALTNGSVNILTGSVVGTVVNNGGSVQIYQGTSQINMVPVAAGTSYGTVGTTGASVWGTLVASSGNGIKQYVSGVDIVVTSGTVDVAVTNIGIGGSTGAGVLTRGQYIPGGGISKNFNPVQPSGTGGTIAFWMGGAGTVAVTVQYWQGA